MRFKHPTFLIATLAAFLAVAGTAQAQDKVRIAQQYGLSYLPLHVALERKLIEKHATAMGHPSTSVEMVRLGSGAAVNDAMISGGIDVAMAGATVLVNLWDKTVGRNAVKGMMAIADTPVYFNTVDPRIKSLRDFGENDRIAMTAGRGTQHAMILQMAAAREFGWDQREKLDALTVSMAHPDGVVALLSGNHHVKTHATTVPFIQMELAHPGVRTILKSDEIVGGRHTLIVAYAPEKWRTEKPKLYAATYAALSEAMDIIKADKKAAAELYKRAESSKLEIDQILKILNDENMLYFTATPSKMMPFADHMVKTGLLKNKPASWKDFFFDNVHHLPGS
jgi:NitT/TauT family transport system substrate-binding protein